LTIGLAGLIKPGIGNELRANYSNQRVGLRFTMDDFGGAVPLPDSLLFPSGLSSTNGILELLPLGAGELVKGKLGIDEQEVVPPLVET
jgi:hypothetical protein